MLHLMIDLETFGTDAGCVIRSIGAVPFDPETGEVQVHKGFYTNVDRAASEALGLTVDPGTEKWWSEQSPEAQAALLTDPMTPANALGALAAYYDACTPGAPVWGHGAGFDEPILRFVYRRLGMPVPWGHRAPRDTRTIFDLCRVEMGSYGVKHNALDDAIRQATAVGVAYARIVRPETEVKT